MQPKVFEFAKQLGMETLTLMDKIREWKIPVKSHMAELTDEVMEEINQRLKSEKTTAKPVKKAAVKRKTAAPAKKTAPAPAAPKFAGGGTKKAEVAAEPPRATGSRIIRRKRADEQIVDKTSEEIETSVDETADLVAAPVEETTAPDVELHEEAPVVEVAAAQPETLVEEKEVMEAQPESVTTPQPGQRPEPSRLAPRKREIAMGPSGPTSGIASSLPGTRGKILGRIDLSKLPGHGPREPRDNNSNQQRPQRTAGARNIRPGFVAPAMPTLEEPSFEGLEKRSRFDDKPKKRGGPANAAGAGRELNEPVQDFSAAEFRKREMIFQPKKKKGLLNRDSLKTQITTPKATKRVIKVEGAIRVSDFAQAMGVKLGEVSKVLVSNGIMATPNTEIDFETAALIAPEFKYEVINVERSVDDLVEAAAFGDLESEQVLRPPVVTVMGHVDHGKTTLLDAIRNAKVAAGEAGGITQHIGAYQVSLSDNYKITFLDTPGHEAFTAMRARGANVTDIAIIVVAADDGVMQQTAEAINHAKAAGVPIIVAVNKMDKQGANPDRIKQQLTEFELVPEEWGGSTIFAPVSALKKEGIDSLLESIRLVAEVQELKSNPKRSGTGIVIESRLEKGRGSVATILVKDGTVQVGQSIVAGTVWGRVRSLTNDRGERVKEAGPSTPVEILGLPETPKAGDRVDICESDEVAEQVAEKRKAIALAESKSTGKSTIEEIFAKVQKGNLKELPLIVKTDVAGSLEAVLGILEGLSTSEVKVKVVHSAVGGITESDVLLASTCKGMIVGFNVRPDGSAEAKGKQEGVDIRTYSIIYELKDEVKKMMGGLLAPEVKERVLGRAEVRNTFVVPKFGTIAGCSVTEGKITRSSLVRLVRDGRVIFDSKVSSLKRFKDDAREVATGFECGIGIENYNDIKVGDVIEGYVKEETIREL